MDVASTRGLIGSALIVALFGLPTILLPVPDLGMPP